MTEIAIKVQNLSKCYHIYDNPRDRLKQFIAPRLQRLTWQQPKQYFREFWAVKDVSFEIKRGETVGIIGRNGSGKSTLLQMICGTLNPTHGSIETNGRIAALLELGSGFNPEFTGRENVYMNASVLGLSNKEIDERFDDIVAFAEIGDFIEQPVKTYSSGMMVRLAFAVAINVDPEILIVDEALSVGDELFQRKCFSRIEAIRENGSTILFVSHSGGAIVELCDRAVLMDAGEKLAVGMPKKIIGNYQKLLYAPAEKQKDIRDTIIRANSDKDKQILVDDDFKDHNEESVHKVEPLESFDPNLMPTSTIEYESHGAYIENPMILTIAGEQVNNLVRGKIYRYVYTVRFIKPANNVRFGMLIKTTSGVELGGGSSSANSNKDSLAFVNESKTYQVEFRFCCALNAGVYFLNAGVEGNETYLHRLIDVAMFRVIADTEHLATGVVDFGCFPEIELQE